MSEPEKRDNGEGVRRRHSGVSIDAGDATEERAEGGSGGDLKSQYGVDYVAAIPRSPTSLFVYWELGGERSADYKKKSPRPTQWFLSLINLNKSGEVNWRSEVPVDPESGNYYLSVQPRNRYRVELGVKDRDVFHSICHSRERIMPPAAPPQEDRKKAGNGSPAMRTRAAGPENDAPPGLIWRADLLEGLSSS